MKFLDAVKFAYTMIANSGCPAKIVREIRAQFNMKECEIMRIRLWCGNYFCSKIDTATILIDIYNRETKKKSRSFELEAVKYDPDYLVVKYGESFRESHEKGYDDYIFCSYKSEINEEYIETVSYFERFFDFVKESSENEYLITGCFMHKITDYFEKEHLRECLDKGLF